MSSWLNNSGTQKTAWPYLFFSFILGGLCSIVLFGSIPKWLFESQSASKPDIELPNQNSSSAGFTICKVKNFSNIKPLAKEMVSESEMFAPMKKDLTFLIDSLKKTNAAQQISVYIREFDHRGWMAINNDERYHPASLMKVPLLICVLQMAQGNPDLLKQKMVFDMPAELGDISKQYYPAPTIVRGERYTVQELLSYMMAYSDNNSTWLLASRVDPRSLKKLFTDFCLPEMVEDDVKFTMTAKECAVFFKAIYSASCLSPEYSEYAAELMSHCTFKEGFAKGFPENTKMWHKYGDWRSAGYDNELHETGIVFIKNKPFLVSIMTKGSDTERLAEAIRIVCKKIYEDVPLP